MTAHPGYTPDPRDLAESTAGLERPDPLLSRAARYSRWDGSQASSTIDPDELMDALTEDVMAEGDVGEALRRLMERGWRPDDPTRPGLPGLRELAERLRRRREAMLDRYRLDDVVGELRRELDEVVGLERAGAERRLAAGAQGDPTDAAETAMRRAARNLAERRLAQLDALPSDTGDRIRALMDDDFLEPEARRRFDELVERLRRVALDRVAEGLADAVRGLRPEDLARTREMVRELDGLLEERLAGGDPDASGFLGRYGDLFPGATDLDDIIEQLAERMSAAASLLRSLRPEQRAELGSMLDAALQDDRLRWDLARLGANMDRLVPGGVGERVPFGGDEPVGLEGALDAVADVQGLEALEEALEAASGPLDLADIDREALARLGGDETARQVEALTRLAEELERAGYLTRHGERLELTPRGSRRLGQAVLDDLFAKLRRDAFGGHPRSRPGRGGEAEETTKPYDFGDPFLLDLRATLENALRRPANAPEARGERGERGLRLHPDDFEVRRTEELTRTSTVLLVDMSRSMLLRGCYVAAKKVAIALDTLIRTQYPRDDLLVVGFAYYARELRPEHLPELSWHGFEYGTNLQHGLLLARRYLASRSAANKEIIVITDGEPTAHLEDGQVEFSYPPTRRTLQETLREVVRCTRAGITINTFMLERSRALADFVALMTRLNHGRAFYSDPEHLGAYVLVDLVQRRTRRVG